MKTTKSVYQLKIVLLGIRPQIWRRVQVSSDITLDDLHMVLQAAMGWTNSHLHAFDFGDIRYAASYGEGELEELEMEDELGVPLAELIAKMPPDTKPAFGYEYDFGDGWEHAVTVEKTLPAAAGVKSPICIDGKRACPPDDSGGVPGYGDLLKILKNPAHPEYKDMRAWAGRSFDPEVFDVTKFAKNLRRLYAYQ